ncbi:uncharacterized protein LOC113292991 [Papaver somniferum]|uniref:uncharacterized protein LOC113292991 n=1 Tax=Papaver somniferum TaxID=3469 RepID=UPI000E701CCD|nr:uncharacterized protein LOC113292991 [Papaver somniferum]
MGKDDDAKSSNTNMTKKDPVYHLGSSDGPGVIITPIILKGTNYVEWARAIGRYLKAKRKFGLVDGTVKKPTGDVDQVEEWSVVHSMIVSWITNTLDSSIRSTMRDYDDANTLWTHLKNRFFVVSGTRTCQLKSSLSECKQGNSEPVAVYFGRLNKIWDELITYMKTPRCSCDNMYGSIREQLLARDPLPTIDAAYQAVVNAERLRIGEVCNHCHQDGHTEEGCFELIGYPYWWGDRPRGGFVSGRGSGRGNIGGGRNNPGRGGFAYGRGRRGNNTNPVRANNLSMAASQQSNTSAGPTDGAGLVGVTTTQLQKEIKNCSVGLLDGKTANSDKIGTIILPGGLRLENVLYVPQLNCNLISVTQMTDESICVVQFTNKLCVIQDLWTRKVIRVGVRQDGLYFFCGVPPVKVLAVGRDSYELWHQRMRHPSEKVLQKIPVCLDLWGPYKTPSSCGAHYFLTIVDDFSRGVWIYLLRNKTEVESMFLNFIALIKRQFGKEIKCVRSDNGTKFNSLREYFKSNGIIFETSCVGTPQQNGRVERKHQHIMNVARALRFQANLPIKFWGECALTAAYLINRTPTPLLGNKTPYEIMFGKLPQYDQLLVFGCLCYVHNQNNKGDKFASRGRRCVFLGYPFGKKAWQVYDLDTHQFLVSRDVDFYELQFPYVEIKDEQLPNNATMSNEACWSDDEDVEELPLPRSVTEPPEKVVKIYMIALHDQQKE